MAGEGPPFHILLVACAALLALGSAPALATCPPEPPPEDCYPPQEGQLVPDAAEPVLALQGQGVWMYECVNMTVCSGGAEQQSCTSGWQYRFANDYEKGSHANLTGDGFAGQFSYKPSGFDAIILLWQEGNETANRGVLTMPLSDAEPFNATDGSTRSDVRFVVTGCCSGTICSSQESLSLPPIYLAIRTNYSEPAPQPPPEAESDRQLPATCDPSDPKLAVLTFPYTATFTLFTCS